MRNFTRFISLLVLASLLGSCIENPGHHKTPIANQVVADDAFTSFFARDCCGTTGSDGFYSVLLPDGRTVWIFGDTFLGTVNPDGSRDRRTPVFIRNAFAVQEGDSLKTLYALIDGWESSLVIPPDANKGTEFSEDSLWYWPGDGFIEGGKLKVFMSAFIQAHPGNWGFKWVGTSLATFSLPEIELERLDDFPYSLEKEVHYGHAVCDDDTDHTYIYGAGIDKRPYVARAPKGDILAPWEFFTHDGWVLDPASAEPMLDFAGSEQFSVFKYGDKYVYMTQAGGFVGEIRSFISDSPFSGWENEQLLYDVPQPQGDSNLFAYNAVAHPQFMENDAILVSYCVNSFSLDDLFKDASKYRPVFIRIPMRMILERD